MKTNVTVYDPSGVIHITTLDYTPNIEHIRYYGFFMFRGVLREVRDIHQTKNGTQIELEKIS